MQTDLSRQYVPLSPACQLRCQAGRAYASAPFARVLAQVNEACGAPALFPPLVAAAEPAAPCLCYTLARPGLRRVVPLGKRAVPRRTLDALQTAIARLHAWAEAPAIPWDVRACCRTFALPDPARAPGDWLLSLGDGGWRLHILWAHVRTNVPDLLPLSGRALAWPDAAERGHAAAQNRLGWYYERGVRGFARDRQRARQLYRAAAAQGLEQAQANLARLEDKAKAERR